MFEYKICDCCGEKTVFKYLIIEDLGFERYMIRCDNQDCDYHDIEFSGD